MKRIFLILLLITIAVQQYSFGQKADKLVLKIAPLSLLDPFGSNIHLGSEFFIKDRLSLETDVAAYLRVSDRDDDTPRIKDRSGFKVKPEVRYYLNRPNKEQKTFRGFYIADELFFITDKYRRGDTFVKYNESTQIMYYDYEKIRRFELGNNVKIGYQAVTKIKLTFDFYIGAGLEYYNATYDYEITDPICCPVMRFFENPIYKGFNGSFTFGIKFGYIL
jgi:hypothetical protein